MKKLVYIIGLVAFSLMLVSCDKEAADKDVENCIKKLELFNTTFDKLYSDGIISKDTLENQKSSEFDQLELIASEYYDIINKINSNIKDEHEDLEKGKKIDNYEEAYKTALDAQKDNINSATQIFQENMSKINSTVEENIPLDETEEEDIDIETMDGEE